MIWINISNILKVDKFSGIARTEYELCLYAYKLSQQGYAIKFCTFDDCLSFIEIESQQLSGVLHNLKNDCVVKNSRLKFKPKLKRSIFKRLNALRVFCGIVSHCFRDGDLIISVGQNLGSSEMRAFEIIKKKINIELKLLCHDLIPINYPEFFLSQNTSLFSRYMNQTIKVVDHFYCNSEFTKTELSEYHTKMGVNQPPMTVVTLGCDLYMKQITDNKSDLLKSIMNQPYLLFVSTIEIRKNHNLIYQMYLKLLEQGVQNLPPVYFVGRRGWKVEALLNNLDNDSRIKDKIRILDNVSDSDLIQLYKHCWFTLYPSFIEGYGLPVAESLSFGKFCLSSNAGSLTEVGKEYIDYADPHQLDQWAEKFLFLINHPEYVAEKEKQIRDQYRPTSWEECSKEILNSELFTSKQDQLATV
ncbi:glycosyltransferase family 1 protein [Acinetobacter sp. ANC 4805]|uniref:glycosyltransferase family 4 protein n=1 Tax=Acinetobacter sp. ANC 4805 TaxID=2923425 RepID=UPI001F4BA538|nr:glycosyltransferase family 1 protein [Acinetobacter sp. ANC 4805]MCH7310294.1 glycosyltransferase family 4 protein [Acinetobacter sp. ANC 4805]